MALGYPMLLCGDGISTVPTYRVVERVKKVIS